ncbi:MAG: helix-turn-helix transcriptional regulator [Chthoniobacterales bacterium]
MSGEIEVIQRQPETLNVKFERLFQQRLAEIMARRDLSTFAPFCESKETIDKLRRLQTAQDWHKWGAYYAKFGCLHCHARPHEKPHYGGSGMCRTCKKRIQERLERILECLDRQTLDAEGFIDGLIDQEKLARKALRLPKPASKTQPSKIGRPKMKPSILRGDSGERVRKLREVCGMSQADLAEAAGVDRKTVISFERGDHRASPPHCDAIRKVLIEGLVRAFWP